MSYAFPGAASSLAAQSNAGPYVRAHGGRLLLPRTIIVGQRAKTSASDTFTKDKWEANALQTMLGATNALDELCHAIVQIRGVSHYDALREIRDLGLTVAGFERSLFSYAEAIANNDDSGSKSSVTSGRSSPSVAAVMSQHQRSRSQHTLPTVLNISGPTHSPSPREHSSAQRVSFSPSAPSLGKLVSPRSTIPTSSAASSISLSVNSRLSHTARSEPALPGDPAPATRAAHVPPSSNTGFHSPHGAQHMATLSVTDPNSGADDNMIHATPHASPSTGSMNRLPHSVSSEHLSRPPQPKREQDRQGGVFHAAAPPRPLSHAATPRMSAAAAAAAAAAVPSLRPAGTETPPLFAIQLHDLQASPPELHLRGSRQTPSLGSAPPTTAQGSPVDLFVGGGTAPSSALGSRVNSTASLQLRLPPSNSARELSSLPRRLDALQSSMSQSGFPSARSAGLPAGTAVAWNLPGGVVSLLETVTVTLHNTTAVLRELQTASSFPVYLARRVRPRVGRKILLPLVFLAVSRLPLWRRSMRWIQQRTRIRPGTLFEWLPLELRYRFTRWGSVLAKWPLVAFVRSSYAQLGDDVGLDRWVWALWAVVVPGVLYLAYARFVRQRTEEIKVMHGRLAFLLRLWQICKSVLEDLERDKELGVSDAVAHTHTHNPSTVSLSRWMLELVPPNLDASFWYESWELSMLKYSLDVMYSSASFWHSAFGMNALALPVVGLAAMYYGLRPQAAAMKCSAVMAKPDTQLMAAAWSLMDNKVLWLLNLWWRPKLAVMRDFVLRGNPQSDYEPGPGFAPPVSPNQAYALSRSGSHSSHSDSSALPLDLKINVETDEHENPSSDHTMDDVTSNAPSLTSPDHVASSRRLPGDRSRAHGWVNGEHDHVASPSGAAPMPPGGVEIALPSSSIVLLGEEEDRGAADSSDDDHADEDDDSEDEEETSDAHDVLLDQPGSSGHGRLRGSRGSFGWEDMLDDESDSDSDETFVSPLERSISGSPATVPGDERHIRRLSPEPHSSWLPHPETRSPTAHGTLQHAAHAASTNPTTVAQMLAARTTNVGATSSSAAVLQALAHNSGTGTSSRLDREQVIAMERARRIERERARQSALRLRQRQRDQFAVEQVHGGVGVGMGVGHRGGPPRLSSSLSRVEEDVLAADSSADDAGIGLVKKPRDIHVTLLSKRDLGFSINSKLRSTGSSREEQRRQRPQHRGGARRSGRRQVYSRGMRRNNSALSAEHMACLPVAPLVIYLHGGAFLANFKATDMRHVAQWAVDTDAPILYVNYSLAPAAYPTAMNECYDVYKWAVEGRLGIKPSRIILAGDSAGGHLAVGVCIKAIQDNMRRPDGLVLAYPTLNLGVSPTTSKAIYMMDPIAPMNLVNQCISMYLPSVVDADHDYCISPLLAPNELLRQLPPTSVLAGSFDPFLDDSVDLAHRLFANGVPCKLRIFPKLPHQGLYFSLMLQDARDAVALMSQWLVENLRPNGQTVSSARPSRAPSSDRSAMTRGSSGSFKARHASSSARVTPRRAPRSHSRHKQRRGKRVGHVRAASTPPVHLYPPRPHAELGAGGGAAGHSPPEAARVRSPPLLMRRATSHR